MHVAKEGWLDGQYPFGRGIVVQPREPGLLRCAQEKLIESRMAGQWHMKVKDLVSLTQG